MSDETRGGGESWKSRFRSHIQTLGFLTLPRMRVYFLVLLSTALFLFVLFRLLPSAQVLVWPRQETVSQTANIFLSSSGALRTLPSRVRTLDLVPLSVTVHHAMTFDDMTKVFSGNPARLAMTIVNESHEAFSLFGGTRFVNQAGMIFRIRDPVELPPLDEVTVQALAQDVDLYGELIGERGNVPANLKWEIPALSLEERKVLYGINKEPGFGGTTGYETVLKKENIAIAKKRLEQSLLSLAKQLTEEERLLKNSQREGESLEILYYDELTKVAFRNFRLPEKFVGEAVTTLPVEGDLQYTAYAFDAAEMLHLLERELRAHTRKGERLIPESIRRDRLVVHVIDYADDFSWIKLTVDLAGTVKVILDPLSLQGIRFGKTIREKVKGLSKEEALRIIRNMPEVEKVELSLWPPWKRMLPEIPTNIVIVPQ